MWTKRVVLVIAVMVLSLRADAVAGLVGYWALDEGSGTVANDSSGGGHDGQLVDGPEWVPGILGGALELDGVKARIDVPYWSEVTPTEGTTVVCWVFPKDNTRSCLVGQFEAYGMALMDGLQLKSVVWGSDWVLSDVTIARNEWSHLAMTWDVLNNQRKVFLNGAVVGERADSAVPQVQNNLGIGLWTGWPDSWGDDSFTGLIDDVRLYNIVLSADQVAGLFQEAAPALAKASDPNPANGALNVNVPLLQWSKGATAAFHNVYLGTSPELTDADRKASRQPMTLYYHLAGLVPGTTYYWRVDEIDKDGTTIHSGDVWTFMAQDVKAYHPTPMDGATDSSPTPTLVWLPGQTAVEHQVYFSDSRDAVSQGATEADKGKVKDPNFTPGALESLTTYYWRVDELVVGGTVKTGAVWSFTTYLPIDDFESYNDEEGKGTRIYETWLDGWADASSGSRVGYMAPPFAEQKIVHGGLQAMPMDYNNVSSPYTSNAQRTFTPPADWTADGAAYLVLYVRGKTTNAPATLFLAIDDAAGHNAWTEPNDKTMVTTAKWNQWKIPIELFTTLGVNMTRVKKLTIGAYNDAATGGGTGTLYFDDMYLLKSQP